MGLDSKNDFQHLLSCFGKDIQINTVHSKAILKFEKVNENYDDITITTDQPLLQGDTIIYEETRYIIVSQVSSERYGKYKGMARPCNFNISIYTHVARVKIGVDGLGRPVYEDTPQYEEYPAIITSKVADWSTGGQINLPQGEVEVTIKDTQSANLNEGDTFTSMGKTWNINYIDRSKVGLLVMRCKNS
ncbi:hypothetical protein [Guptibacillus hwajinpoensis]|uniref:hypothetical protein n=1 Tax=Guptibacillus hwajinpoensis TaxID=208199 RepID=UPI0037369A9F